MTHAQFSGRAILLLLATATAPSSARGDEVPNDRAFDLQLFEPAVGTQNFLTVGGAELIPREVFQVGLSLTYLTKPLVVYDVDPMGDLTRRTGVVDSIVAGQIGGAYGYRDRLQFGVRIPAIFSLSGDGLDPGSGNEMAGGLSAAGLGDLSLEVGYRVLARDGFTVSALPALTVPTSTGFAGSSAFLGDDLPSLRPRGAVEWRSPDGRLSAGANLGLVLRKPRQIYSTTVGQQLTYAAAAVYRVRDEIDFVGELFGRNGFGSDLDASPLEMDAAVRIALNRAVTATIGAGAGLIAGLGAPGVRVFAQVSWSPDTRDSDADGVANLKDDCPLVPEDRDGFLDADGCPEDDDDKDFMADAEDRCPQQREDTDGYEDTDGCPEPDNDLDGFLDERDSCPIEAEDKILPFDEDGCPATARDSDDDGVNDAQDKCPTDGEDMDEFADDDGCPDPDNDLDGIIDADDATCPAIAEDRDGFADEDGCPEPDNDEDGYLDAADTCPNERETVNGITDEDGCPDAGGTVLASYDGKSIVLAERVVFDVGIVRPRSFPLLKQVALVMRGTGSVTLWRLVVSAVPAPREEAARALAEQQAQAVVAYLVAKGVPVERLDVFAAATETAIVRIIAAERVEAAPVEEAPAEELPTDAAPEIDILGLPPVPAPAPAPATTPATTPAPARGPVEEVEIEMEAE